MKVSVILEDNTIVVDGIAFELQNMPTYDPNWRAIQWMDEKGWIEQHRGGSLYIDSLEYVQPFIDAHSAELKRLADIPPPGPEPITSVTPRQAKLALLGAGLLDAAEAAVAAADKATQITWSDAIEFRRDDAMINAMGKTTLGLTDEQIDQLFLSASKL